LLPLRDWMSIFTHNVVGTPKHLELLLRYVVLIGEWLMLFWMYRNKILVKA
jgi:hypothetical protein